ncbi:hypothetical protein GUITHDRAFT_153407, partial [Guillardia theta CCMP2712]
MQLNSRRRWQSAAVRRLLYGTRQPAGRRVGGAARLVHQQFPLCSSDEAIAVLASTCSALTPRTLTSHTEQSGVLQVKRSRWLEASKGFLLSDSASIAAGWI